MKGVSTPIMPCCFPKTSHEDTKGRERFKKKSSTKPRRSSLQPEQASVKNKGCRNVGDDVIHPRDGKFRSQTGAFVIDQI